MINEYFFDNQASLLAALLDDCERALNDAIKVKGSASFLVSGGSSPKLLYRQLSKKELSWGKVHIALVDERWVDPGVQGSNETFIAENLLINHAREAHYHSMKTEHDSAQAGLESCESCYQNLPRPFDLVLLGMGSDGHTASLFPQAEGLSAAFDLNRKKICAAIEATPSEVTGALTQRMTLSLFGLLQATKLHLLITGEKKLAVYKQAKESTEFETTPISAVLQQTTVPVSVYWAP